MTVVRYKNRPNDDAAFNNLLSDLFPQTPSFYRSESKEMAPVNIRETEKEYVLDVVAPGLNKEDFKINLDNNILTISVERKEEAANENEKMVRREFKQAAFKRSFTLDEKVNTEAISAQYVNGVLTLNLPKKEEVKPATKQITIQ
jgi:HSP20 family protein